MSRELLILSVFLCLELAACLKCYKSGYPWPKECPPVIYEKYGARPACLWAIIIDEYNNPMEIQRCAKIGDSHLGACDRLRKIEIVKQCTLCEKDQCNPLRGINNTGTVLPINILSTIVGVAVTLL